MISRILNRFAVLTLVFLASLAVVSPALAQFGNPVIQPQQQEQFGDSRDGVTISASAAVDSVARGGRLPVVVVLDHKTGWHTWTNPGNDPEGFAEFEYAIRTDLSAEASAGVVPNLGLAQWPEAHGVTMNLSGTPESFAVFEKRALVSIPVTIADDAPLGAATLTLTVTFQTCNDMTCLPPFDQEIEVSFNIVETEADAAALELTGDFAAFPMSRFPAPEQIDPTVGVTVNADSEEGDSRDVVDITARTGVATIAPNGDLPLLIDFTFDDGWHAWLNAGNVPDGTIAYDSAIFTEIVVEGSAGLSAKMPFAIWPEHHTISMNITGTPADYGVFEGRAAVQIPVIAEDAPLGAASLTIKLTYQACNDAGICMGPVFEQEILLPLEVVADDTAPTFEASGDFSGLTSQLFLEARSSDIAGDSKTDKAAAADGIKWKKMHWWVAFGFVALAMLWMLVKTPSMTKKPVLMGLLAIISLGTIYGTYTFVRGITSTPKFWQHMTLDAFDEAVASGDVVYAKFTAQWCANCQVNERILTASEEAVALLSSDKVTAFKVEFDGPNPDGDALKDQLGGGGIPLMGIWHPDHDEPFIIRGPIPSAQVVIDALNGKSFEAGEDESVFDFLGFQFSVGNDAILIIFALAFVAGFLMNLTPCVLPVIPIKILSLQAHAKHPAKCFYLGVVFSLGIIALYAVIGLLMAGLLTGAQGLEWGEQFESWWLNAIIAVIIAAMAIGLLGVFDIKLPGFLYMFNPQSDTASGSFFMGVFTAVLSTPCTGPLLGATLAWVATKPPAIAFLTLLIMGAGMAFPYVLLTAKPSLLQKMPKSGPGSEVLKQVMGLLLLAVAAYFVGVTYNALAADAGSDSSANQTTAEVQSETDGAETSEESADDH